MGVYIQLTVWRQGPRCKAYKDSADCKYTDELATNSSNITYWPSNKEKSTWWWGLMMEGGGGGGVKRYTSPPRCCSLLLVMIHHHHKFTTHPECCTKAPSIVQSPASGAVLERHPWWHVIGVILGMGDHLLLLLLEVPGHRIVHCKWHCSACEQQLYLNQARITSTRSIPQVKLDHHSSPWK